MIHRWTRSHVLDEAERRACLFRQALGNSIKNAETALVTRILQVDVAGRFERVESLHHRGNHLSVLLVPGKSSGPYGGVHTNTMRTLRQVCAPSSTYA
jgi:hypothetical protein